MAIITKEKKRIACYESDSKGKMLPTAAMNYFQEISTYQGDILKVGGRFLQENRISWFLVKYVIRFIAYPRHKDEVTITTEATGMDKFCGTRRFTIEDSKGEKAVIADTQWLLMNRATERMERINNYSEFEAYGCFEKGEPLFKKLTKISRFDLEKTFNVRYLDIDFNNHVNHVKYLAWAIEVLPLEAIKTGVLREIRIIYKAQGFYGDQVKALGEMIAEGHYRVDIVNQENSLLCQLELILD
ncbi:MAG: acyl-[acyl-carrier-protein] thioesterase [Acetobacterium sp.]